MVHWGLSKRRIEISGEKKRKILILVQVIIGFLLLGLIIKKQTFDYSIDKYTVSININFWIIMFLLLEVVKLRWLSNIKLVGDDS